VCVVFYSAYTFPNRKVKSGVGELREGSLARPPYAREGILDDQRAVQLNELIIWCAMSKRE